MNVNFWKIYSNYFKEIRNCKVTNHGREYVGTISQSQTGKSCIPWKRTYIEQLRLNYVHYYDVDAISGITFCRNPTNFLKGPWCFVDKSTYKWEYCNIPICLKDRNWCKDSERGTDYTGPMNFSKSGKVCNLWINQVKFQDQLFPEKSRIYAGNKCRNPDNSEMPWCYCSYNWDYCFIPKCDSKLSQVEYFGGYDFLKTIEEYTTIITLKDVYESMTVTVSISIVLWRTDVRKESSMWATDYDPKCQTDMKEYEYCQMYQNAKSNDHYILTYLCFKPHKYLIFISPQIKSAFQIKYIGSIYKPFIKPSENFFKYQEKVRNYLNQRNKQISKFPFFSNHGFYYLLDDNVIPYAFEGNDKVVVTISSVGKGFVAFLPAEGYVRDENYSNLKDLFEQVYKKSTVIPKRLTKESLKELELERQTKYELSTPVIWNAHDEIGKRETEILLRLIKAGVRIIIGLKPWAYYYYNHIFVGSELEIVFLASGIWPSIDDLGNEIKIINKDKINAYPLVHLLNYAATSVKNAQTFSYAIKDILSNVPFQQLVHRNSFNNIEINIQFLYAVYSTKFKHLIPCLNKPLTNKSDKAVIEVLNEILLSPFGHAFIAPGLSFYPGLFQTDYIRLLTVKLKLNLKLNNEIHQLGLAALPGKEFSVKITKSISNTCNIYINFHSINTKHKDEWEKWPSISTEFQINRNKWEYFSFSFGGLISISCKENNDNIDIVFRKVVQVPYFDRRNHKNLDEWIKINNQVSPWVILAGDTLVFVVSSNAIRNMADPNVILSMYDSMVKEQFHLKGRSVSNTRREVLSTDIQIWNGYMHSGYPIGTMIHYVTNPAEYSFFNIKNIEKYGEWGLLHEIGHNLQDDLFTFEGTGEVTNNIFTLIGIESMTKQNSWSPSEGWVKTRNVLLRMVNYINNGKFMEWQNDPFLALGIYAQLRGIFGWEFYSQLFRGYNESKIIFSNENKIQLWIKKTSMIVKMNLCPLYDLWRWPLDGNICEESAQFPQFLPDDFLTKMVKDRVTEIIDKYGGSSLVKRIPNKIREIVGPVTNKLTVEGSKVIEEIQINMFFN